MALATRCPFCETVFRLDPHLLAPHDGRVRCGHCQEVFDAAHYQFERDETVMAALAATSPNYRQEPPAQPHHPAPDYGHETNSPWASTSAAEVAEGKKTALGIPLHPFIPDTALAPQFDPAPAARSDEVERLHAERLAAAFAAEEAAARARAETDRRIERERLASIKPVPPVYGEPTAGAGASAAEAAARLRTETAFPQDDTFAESPWEAASHAHADARIAAQTRTDPFIGRTGDEPEAASASISDARAEPFVARNEPFADTNTHTYAPPPHEFAAPPESWRADAAEPRFGGAPPFDPVAAPNEPADEPPFPVTRETRPAVRAGAVLKIVGSVVAILLALAAIVQLVWWQRETVMVYWPHSQSLFAQACENLGCVVAPPRDIDALQIENSGLRQVDGSHKLELKLSLRNRFGLSIAYPALELTLLDGKNNVAIRRVLWPKDYARPGSVLTAGIPAHNTMPVIVRLDTGDAVAANYRVQIFYP